MRTMMSWGSTIAGFGTSTVNVSVKAQDFEGGQSMRRKLSSSDR